MLRAMAAGLEVHVVRYDVTRMQLAQLLVPFVVLTSLVARRFPSGLTIAAAVAFQVGTFVVLWRARHRLGRQVLRASPGAVAFAGEHLTRAGVSHWTLVGATARLYGQARSFRLRAGDGDAEALREALGEALGPCAVLRRRGSPRGRLLALGFAVVGVVAMGLAVAGQILPLMVAGVLFTIGGFATFGALSQRVHD